MTRVATSRSAGLIAARQSFRTSGALQGATATAYVSTGRLPAEWHESLGRADYVVTSYATPIAWHIPGEGWVRPEVRYSRTTSRHQGLCPR